LPVAPPPTIRTSNVWLESLERARCMARVSYIRKRGMPT
jgi:hypothetical protein